jgi:phenylpropionate dioxygenase-like ring-hydroxylating dioxygenase large terminal subunit
MITAANRNDAGRPVGVVVQRRVAMELMRRAVTVAETQWPEMADAHMAVPLDYFVDEAVAAREKALYETSPLALVAAAEIAEPNDYLVRNAVGRSVLLTRDEHGVAHAFLNYCRHRGAEPAQGCGNARRLTCPYHAWVYDTQGQLVGMPLRDRHDGFDLSPYGLVELPSEERHGFVWVVLQPGHPIDVAAHLGELDAEIADLGCDKMQYYSSLVEAPLAANWKSVAEGLLEGLHVPFVHADTFNLNPQAANVDLAFVDAIGPHIRWGLPLFDQEEARRLRTVPESEWRPEESIGCIWLISPGLLLANELYGLIYADLSPGSTVTESFMRYGWLSPVTEPPPGQPTPAEMAARAARAVVQDQAVWEGCGRGLSRGAHSHELIGRNEKAVQLFHERLAAQLGYTGLHDV